MSRNVFLGLHGYSYNSTRQMHDAGVCIIDGNGTVLAAVDEERLSRAKRDGTFPLRSYQSAMNVAGVVPDDIKSVAFVDRRSLWQSYWVWRYAMETYLRTGITPWKYLLWWNRQALQFNRYPPPELRGKTIKFYEHHRCHAASAYYPSPFNRATVVTLDGMGDFSIGGSVSRGFDGNLDLFHRSNGYFSPGHFYMIVTDYLGFIPGRHEGKVTGLAGYGNPEKAYDAMKKVIRYREGKLEFIAGPVAQEFFNVIRTTPGTRTGKWYFQNHWKQNGEMTPSNNDGFKKTNLSFFRSLWDGYKREDIAAAAQKRLEDIVSAYVKDAIRHIGEADLVLAGGTFANVHLNQRLLELPEVSNIYIHPNMNDGGLSAGAALLMYHEQREEAHLKYTQIPWKHVYLGPSFSDDEILGTLNQMGVSWEISERSEEDVATYLAKGKTVAVFQGRAEYGPRALGNRSLLVSAVDKGIHQRLNSRLNRSEIMPFAPVILEEFAPKWLIGWKPDHIASRFMTITYKINPEFAGMVPGTVHVDGTVRPQVVGHCDNPLIHSILSKYNDMTSIPMAINTSFNMHEEPIVCSPVDAIDTFMRGAADFMLIGKYIVKSKASV